MLAALEEARAAADAGEVPVGAVAVRDGAIIARARNRVEENGDATCHAEIELLRQCARVLGDWRMDAIDIYVTKEPCAMCAGAMVNAHVRKVIFALSDPRCGACGSSALHVAQFPGMLWQVDCEPGEGGDEALAIVRDFFKKVRSRKKEGE